VKLQTVKGQSVTTLTSHISSVQIDHQVLVVGNM
jgi:hypothetical protein